MKKIYKNASWDATKIIYGFKYLFFISCMFMAGSVWGQTTLISPTGAGGFENGSTFAANGWTVENFTSNNTNKWFVGTAATPSAGSNSAYISDNASGTTNNYTNSSPSRVMFWRDITFPAGETNVTLTFKIKSQGESSYDDLSVFIQNGSTVPAITQPTSSGISAPSITNATNIGTYSVIASYTTQSISINSGLIGNSSAPTTRRLIFYWENDASGGTQPPVSIDEVSLISSVPLSYTWNATTGTAAWATASNWTPARTTPNSSDILNFSNGGSSIVQTASGAVGGTIVFANNTTANFQPTAANTLTLNSLTIPSGSNMFLNGTTAQTIAFNSGAVNTIGGRFEVSGAAHSVSFTNSVTTIASTGTLAAGGATAATLTGTTSTLIINGTYEHKYTTVSGTLPTATWAATSNCNIIGYTAASMVPAGTTQTFGNFTWNCTGQGTNNYNLASTGTTTILGTLSVLSTGTTGSLRWGGTGSYILNVVNFSQSGGIFDLASGASGTASFNVSGTFNQTAGSLISSGTSTCNPTLHFSGTTNQSATFTTQPTGPITYRISNPAGITLTGPSANFTIGNGTLGGIRISTTGSNPISFGGFTTALVYNAANSTLTYDATGSYTARATEFPASNGPASLIVGIGSGNVLTVPFSRTVRTTLTMTSGDIDISSNNLTLGTSTSALGTLTYTAGAIRVTTGTMTRWFGTTGLPITIGASILFPIASSSNNRNVNIFFSSATALTSGGTISVGHSNVGGISSITSIADGGYSIDTRTNSAWNITTGNGIAGTGTLGLRLTGGGAFNTGTVANLRLMQASAVTGTHVAGTGTSPNFQAQRTGLSLAQLVNTHYIGAASADMQLVFNSVASGDWNNPSTWDAGSVPTCSGLVNIMNGNNVTVNSAGNQASNTIINVGGTLTVTSGDVTIGCTNNNTPLTNNGTLTVSGGTLNVNGNINSTASSVFNQSGGNINIDGNNGGSATGSVASGTPLLNLLQLNSGINWTGGTLTIIDPHTASTNTNAYAIFYNNATVGANYPSSNHTIQFGNGVSTNAGGNTSGFYINTWAGSAILPFGNCIINGLSGSNRNVTSVYNLPVIGNLTINNGGVLNLATPLVLAGNLLVNSGASFISSSDLSLNLISSNTGTSLNFSPVANSQTIGGAGNFSNLTTSPTANLTNLIVNNSNATGVTLNVPLSVSGTLTMTSGIINTTATNILRLGTASASGTLSGTPSNTNFINGPFARTFAASRTSSAFSVTSTLFPVGVSGATPALIPIDINPVTNATGPVVFTVRADNSMSGTAGAGVTNLASVTWSAIPDNTANLTSAQIRLNRADASVTTTSKILYATANTDPFEGIPGGSTGTTNSNVSGSTQILTADYKNFFSYGDLVVCTAPVDQASNFLASNKTTTSFTSTFDPASSNPTGYLVVRYTSAQLASATVPSDGTLYFSGTALGGTVVGNYYTAPFTFNQTGLTLSTAYTYKIYSFNNTGCAGPTYNPTSYDETITTCGTSYSAPTSVSASNVTTNSMDINYTASTSSGVQDHYIDVATNNTFTNFVSGYQNLQLGVSASSGVQVVNVSGLNASTTYFVRIKATDGTGCESSYTSTLTQATECNPESLPTSVQNFSTYTGSAPSPICWSERTGALAATSTLSGSTSSWLNKSSGFANISSANMGVSINLYNITNDWIISQPIDLGNSSGNYRMRYKFAVTSYNGTTSQTTLSSHKVDIVISTNGGQTWSNANILKTYTGAGTYSNTGSEETIDLSAYTGVIKIAFVATTTATTPDIDFHIDDFIVEQTPAPTITSVTSSNQCGGNTKIVITGTDMNSISSASIGSQTLLPFDSTSSTRLVKTITSPLNGTTSITNNVGTATNATNITFTNAPALSVNSANFTICSGSSATVNVTSTLTDYTSYTWSPATGVTGTTSAIFNPTTTTTYTLIASNSGTGCVNSLTRTVTVDEMPSAISLSQGRTTATCYSGFDSLMVSGGLLSGFSGKIGSGTTTNTTSTPFRRFYGGSKTHALYTPTELNSLGLVAGSVISSIGWVALSGTPAAMTNMNISIGLISSTLSSTSFATSPTNIVFSSASYTPSTGIGNLDFALSTPLVWDGTSHLLIETCYNDGDGGLTTANSISVESSTVASGLNTFNSIDNNASVCATTTGSTSTTRPNLRLSYSRPATYSWSPTIGLFTNRATTTAYAGTSLSKVYSKPTASQKYYLTATNGVCQRRDSIVDSIKNASNLIVLTSANATSAVEQCTDANGWTYYGTAANPDEWLFGIFKNGSNFTATVDITVDPTNKFRKSTTSNGANQEHASYIMSRYWNVNATGTVGSGVKVRFFIDPQDIDDLLDERDDDYDVLKNTTNSNTLAVKGGFEWFKTTNTVYNPTNWTGNKHNGTIVKLTQDAVSTLNGQTYVELSGITSFSGGSGGTSFGPSSNGLFNNGGTVGLPVTWKDVKATAKETGNHIEWSTSSEKNTKSFVVEYSYDAKEFFEASKDILAAGNSASDKFYEFNHDEEFGEMVYYRIKQIDLDGKIDYSKVVFVKRTSKLPEFRVSMYPVPLNIEALTLQIQTIQKTTLAISISDLLGREVYNESIMPSGYTTYHKMNLSHLQQGTYNVTINNGSNKTTQVLVIGK